MLKDITFGQYYDSGSFVHRFDPRAKIVLMILLIVFIFITSNVWSLLYSAVLVTVILIATRVPFGMYLKNIRAILPVLLFTTVINLFYSTGGRVLWKFWILELTTDGIYRAFYMAMRIVFLIFTSSALTYTTTPNDLTDAIERLLSPLKVFGLKNAVHTLAMMMTIALRFIPTLVEETEKIMNAQKARGADLENGRLMQRVRALIPILIPLLISAVRRAYELAEAMECRCYNGGEGRQRMKQLTFGYSDFAGTAAVCLLCAVIIPLNLLMG